MLRDDKEQVAKMKRLRSTGVALLVLYALGAVVASAAQAEEAPFWTVGGTRLGAGQTHFIGAKEAGTVVLAFDGVAITCKEADVEKGAALLGSSAGEPGTSSERVTFSACKVEGNEKGGNACTEVTEPIATKNLRSELVEDKTKTKLLLLLQPASGSLFAELNFPKGCKFEAIPVAGSLLAAVINEKTGEPVELPNPKEQAKSWELGFPAIQPVDVWLIKGGVGKEVETKEFEGDGSPVTLSGTALVSLANAKGETETAEWSPLP
jgi:hypothetical protein